VMQYTCMQHNASIILLYIIMVNEVNKCSLYNLTEKYLHIATIWCNNNVKFAVNITFRHFECDKYCET
jgi:hypothetical protein